MNHLEQLVGEWFEYNGYFVRRNILVGKRDQGGHECELDVVAFHPESQHLVHIEPSLDADSWAKRELRFSKKFKAGRSHIPQLFSGIPLPQDFEQIALFAFGSTKNVKTVGGGEVATTAEFYSEIVATLRGQNVAKKAVPEQFPLIRTIQYCLQYEHQLFPGVSSNNVLQPTHFPLRSFVASLQVGG